MRRLLFRVLLLASTANFALHAQVDARLQACQTDVLDIYGGSRVNAKPEIITLIDNSASMCALAWDSRFYTNNSANIHVNDRNDSVKALLGSSSGDGSVANFQLYRSDLFNDATHGNIQYEVGFSNMTGGLLIKPDGNPVVKSDVSDPDNVQLWVARASHVRFAVTSNGSGATYTYNSVSYTIPDNNCGIQPRPFSSGNYTSAGKAGIARADKTRVVDIPLPWAVFDRVTSYEARTLSPDPTSMGTARTYKHPQHMYLYDPVPDEGSTTATANAQYYEVDTNWWETTGHGGRAGTLVIYQGNYNYTYRITYPYYEFSYIRVHPEYLAWCLFGQDTRNQNETGAFQSGQLDAYSGSNPGGYTVADARDGAAGFKAFTQDSVGITGNGLPQMTRFQAVKYAILKTWIDQQNKVWWAIRFLNLCASSGGFQENGRSSATKCFNSANLKGSPGDRMLLQLAKPTSTNNPNERLQYIQGMDVGSNTPLTFGLLNTYAQMGGNGKGANDSVFNANQTENPIPSCRKSFVVVLSDGNPNDNNAEAQYPRQSPCEGNNGKALGPGDPWASGGASAFTTINFNTIAPTCTNFNIWSLSGVAAHITPKADETSGWPTDDDNAGVAPPFLVTSRPTGVTRRISTMTIGVSMTGTRSDSDGAKAAMYRTALYGLESRKGFDAAHLPLPYAKNGGATRNNPLVNPYFFDAQSPEDIADALAAAFDEARSVTNSMAAPVAPLSGLSVGNQMYFATFTSGTNGQAVWNGDLLMTGMKVVGNSVTLLHKNGTTILDTVNKDTAVWSAATVLDTKGWQNRTLFTLQPTNTTSTTFTTTKLTWNEALGTGTSLLSNTQLGVTTAAARKSLVRFMLGASAAAQADANNTAADAGNRLDMMGDIINSTPLILEFPLAQVPTSGTLATFKSAHAASGSSPLSNMHFRLIIVGDNQGILHGFGEVSGTDTAGILQAAMDELWGFIPPDVLVGLQAWRTGSLHRYLMDGTASLYLREVGTANGVIDGTDICRVLVGLRKGGRSYYCFKFTSNNPSSPEVDWMVRPDDETTTAVIQKMGFSTSTPSSGRIQDGTTVKDVFFLGGGLSTIDVDTQFGTNVKLGRSVLAFRAAPTLTAGTTYELVKSWDYSADTTDKGSIPAAVVPVQVTLQKGKVERLYFGTAFGSVYCLGAKASSGARTDTADLSSWSLRTIFKSKDTTGQSMGSAPSIFRHADGSYPVPLTRTSGSVTTTLGRVPFLGVAFGLGDRNDPMDMDSRNPSVTPYVHRFVVLLDRLDSADLKNSDGNAVDTYGFTEDDLTNLTAVTAASDALITPSSTTYYLKSTCGYKLDFIRYLKDGSKTDYFYKKNVTTPVVLNGMLEFTAFSPNVKASVCGGSGGTSYAYTMCDVLNPVFMNNTTTVNTASSSTCTSGLAYRFNDIPSEAGTVGLSSIVVVGELINTDTGKGSVDPAPLPPPPVPSLTRPRAWRIIR